MLQFWRSAQYGAVRNQGCPDTRAIADGKASCRPTRRRLSCRVLSRAYAWLAGEEALFRALLAERNLDPEKARYWIGVYEKLKADAEG